MILLLESLAAIALFTLMVCLMARNPLDGIYNYPPAIIERVQTLGLIPAGVKKKAVWKKILALAVFGLLLGLLLRYVNGISSFWKGTATAFLLWCIVDWWDALVLDCLWFCHDKRFVIPGTEDMVKDYHDYWFHIKGSLLGMALGIPAALIAGLVCALPL